MKKLVMFSVLTAMVAATQAESSCTTCGVDVQDLWAMNRTISGFVWHPWYGVATGRFDFKVLKAKNGYSKINGKFTSAIGTKGRLGNQQVLVSDEQQKFTWTVANVGEVKLDWRPNGYQDCYYDWWGDYYCYNWGGKDYFDITITGAPKDEGLATLKNRDVAMWEYGSGNGEKVTLKDGEYCFELDTYYFPETINGMAVLSGYLPVSDWTWDESKDEYRFSWASSVRIACNAGTLNKPKGDKIKVNKQTGKPEVVGDGRNMSAVKLTYKESTGLVKGSMKIYLWDAAKQKVKAVTGKIAGFCTYSDEASGLVTIKDVGSFPFWFWKKD